MKLTERTYENENFSEEYIENETLTKIKFKKCKFLATDFTDVSTMYQCSFDSCEFGTAKLNGVELKNSAFLSCKFNNTSFFATIFDDCKMTGSDFSDSECDMFIVKGGDWSYTALRFLNFKKQDFSNINFWGADLTGCKFDGCKMKSCNFSEITVHETSFYGSDLRGSTLGNLDICEVNLKNAKIDAEQCISIAEFLTEAKYFTGKE